MGMFDTVTVFPGIACTCGCMIREFQTKDLDCVLTHYKINAKGQLLRGTWNPTCKKYTQWRKCNITRLLILYTWCPGCNRKSIGQKINIKEGLVEKQKSWEWRLP
jgi:hypothetical protein